MGPGWAWAPAFLRSHLEEGLACALAEKPLGWRDPLHALWSSPAPAGSAPKLTGLEAGSKVLGFFTVSREGPLLSQEVLLKA